MPHVIVKCVAGRTEEQKKALAAKIAADVSEIFNCPENVVSVGIEDYAQEDWKKVWDKDIGPKKGTLHREPGYNLD